MKSVPITNKVVSLNPVQGEVYSIQHYVIKFVSDLRQVSGFLRVLRFHPSIKLTEILLKVALNIINQIKPSINYGEKNHKTLNQLHGNYISIKDLCFTMILMVSWIYSSYKVKVKRLIWITPLTNLNLSNTKTTV